MYRKQLIKVPSCKLHNEDTSSDDEYVRNIITIFHENNSVAFKQFSEKVVRSLTWNSGLMGERKKIHTPQGIVYTLNIDRYIFDRTMRKMSYAIFFHENKFQWNRELIVLTEHLLYKDLSKDDYGQLLQKLMIKLPPSLDKGENPKVFKYKMLTSDLSPHNTILQMIFYEGFIVWVTPNIDSISYRM